ncbi:MAG: ester cyclase [Caldilineaceae bacterium]
MNWRWCVSLAMTNTLAREMARKAAEAGITPVTPPALGEVARLNGQTTPEPPVTPVDEDDMEGFVRRSFHEIWNWRLLNKVRDYYAPNYLAWVPPYRKIHGQSDYLAWMLSFMAAFSDIALTVDHVCSLGTTCAAASLPAGGCRAPTMAPAPLASPRANASKFWASPTSRCATANLCRSGPVLTSLRC